MPADLSIDGYDWAGGREAMVRFGPRDAPTVIVAPALLEEANRTRALTVQLLRLLAARGIAGALPDLPGQGESERDLADMRLDDWRRAFAAAAATLKRPTFAFAIRGGAMLDGDAALISRLHLAPVAGKMLVRDLLRARRVAALAVGRKPPDDAFDEPGPPLRFAGNLVGRGLIRDLSNAVPSRADRTLTLFPDATSSGSALFPPGSAEYGTQGFRVRPPWTASEPFADPRLAAALADDIVGWIARCAA